MSDTAFTAAGSNGGESSKAFGISVRAWLAVFLVLTVCFNHLAIVLAASVAAAQSGDMSKLQPFLAIGEPLYSMAVAALGFYFGQKTAK